MLNLQPTLSNEWVRLRPLKPEDFDALYAIASDPLVWEQHPNKNRYERAVFETVFEGAITSKGALLVSDAKTGIAIGTSRFYDVNIDDKSIAIGYTFYARSCWGKPYNRAGKSLMLDHAFTEFDRVIFHIGAHNTRSQMAIGKMGAVKFAEMDMAYYGEPSRPNFLYEIRKEDWVQRTALF